MVDEGRLRRRLPGTNTIVHDLWHIGRWADHLHSIVSEMSPELTTRLGVQREIWVVERLKSRWGLDDIDLGHVETGMGMNGEMAASMPLPATTELLDYLERAIRAAIATVDGLSEEELRSPAHVTEERSSWLEQGPAARGLVFNWVLAYLRHDAQHLGVMTALAQID
jgi:hypothetical protein